jgi:murein DD-endopeptidase MepM/ murein hydrolase activator NlpD
MLRFIWRSGCAQAAHDPELPSSGARSLQERFDKRLVGWYVWPRRLAAPALATVILSMPFTAPPAEVEPRLAPAATFGIVSTAAVVVGEIHDQPRARETVSGQLAFGAPARANTVATIAVDVANLRSGPGVAFGKVNRLKSGTVVSLIERTADWFRVRTPKGEIGWVAQEVMDVDLATASAVVVAKSTPRSALAKPTGKATILSAGLNLRSGPSTAYRIVGKVFRGASVDIIAQQAGWYQINTARGTSGWARGDFLQLPNGATVGAAVAQAPVVAPAPAAVASAAMVGFVNSGRINLRQGPGTSFAAISQLGARTSLTLVARHGDWYKVRTTGGTNGWVSAELLSITSAVARNVPVTNDVPAAPALAVASNRWLWPTRGVLTSRFGWRWLGGRNFHNGIDIANGKWTPVAAARGGTVMMAGWCGGIGYCVTINHGDGITTEYGHLASHPPVRRGQLVNAGGLIGYMGMTYDRRGGGYATGVHLHFTVRRNGQPVNPLAYLP